MSEHMCYTEPGIHRGTNVGRLLAYIRVRPIECLWKNCHRVVPLTEAIFGLCRLHAENVEFLDVYAADVPAMMVRMKAEAEREIQDRVEKRSPTEILEKHYTAAAAETYSEISLVRRIEDRLTEDEYLILAIGVQQERADHVEIREWAQETIREFLDRKAVQHQDRGKVAMSGN